MQPRHEKSIVYDQTNPSSREKKIKPLNLIPVGITFGFLYWFLEAVRDVLAFDRGTLLERLFMPGFMAMWMRLLVVFIIILLSIYAQSKRKVSRIGKRYIYGLKVSLVFGALYWILEGVRDAFVFDQGSLLHTLFLLDPAHIWMRLLPMFILTLFGIYSQVLIDEQMRVEQELLQKKEDLQRVIQERTRELLESNQKLRKEFRQKTLAENELYRVNRALRTLSACNRSLVNLNDEFDLIRKMCDLLCSTGEYAKVWAAYFENDSLLLQYQSGSHGTFPVMTSLADFSVVADALKGEGEKICIQYETDQSEAVWYQYALEQGFVSSVFIPLVVKNEAIGVMGVYTKDHVFKNDQEMELLGEIANDLAFGISTIRMQADHDAAVKTLKESEEKFGTVAENLNVGIFRYNPNDAHFLEANPILLTLLGFENKNSFLQTQLKDHFQFQTDVKNLTRKMNLQGHVTNEEVLIKGGKGEAIWCSINMNAVFDSGHHIRYYDGVIENINQRKKLEKEKKEMQLQLIQAQKMEEIGVLAGGVAHDFNNILTALLSISELNMQMLNPEDDVYKDMKDVFELANRGAGITRQLLIFSRKQYVEYKMLDINETIEGMKKMLNRLIDENVTIESMLQKDLPLCLGDQGTLEQVIMNLVVNARDAMPDGGRILLSTRVIELTSDEAALMKNGYSGQFVQLRVQDEGSGIEPALQNRIFEAFFSTKGTGKGTGLGLSVVASIVQQHRGWIHLESEMGRGSIFNIYIPVSTDGQAAKAADSGPDIAEGQGEQVLWVEDDKRVLASISQALKEGGYAVQTAENAHEAMHAFFAAHGNFQYIISDVVLPDENGLRLVEELISYNPKLKVLLCSGYAESKSGRQIIEERGFCFLQKPFSIKQLTAMMQKMA